MKHGMRELQWLQCFKKVFLEIPNVPKGTVFTEKVTYEDVYPLFNVKKAAQL